MALGVTRAFALCPTLFSERYKKSTTLKISFDISYIPYERAAADCPQLKSRSTKVPSESELDAIFNILEKYL